MMPPEILRRFEEVISTREQLARYYDPPKPYVADKVISRIDGHCRRFIEKSPFLLLASCSGAGVLDLSPKGDPAGFVRVLDEHTLAIPDRLGNNRVDSFRNILENNAVGLFFLIPGNGHTLRVSGRGFLVRDRKLQQTLAHEGREPKLVLIVSVERALFHCAKCVIRSGLWQPEGWPELAGVPTLAEALAAHAKMAEPLEAVQALVTESEKTRLY